MSTPSSTSAPPPQDPDQTLNPDHHDPPSSSSSSSSPSSATSLPSNPNSPRPLQSISPTPKKTQPLPWSHQETVNLILAYQEKWYSLKRGQLKVGQWEEVTVSVTVRCGFDEPSKTASQCRHKIEKLRKRYRAEKQKLNPYVWEYFDLMDSMERGPLPISARPMAMIEYQNSNPIEDEDNHHHHHHHHHAQAVNDAKYDDTGKRNRSKSINHIVRGPWSTNMSTMDRKFSGGGDWVSGFLRNPMFRKRKQRFERFYFGGKDEKEKEKEKEEEEGEGEEEEEERGGGRAIVLELAAEINTFAERFVKMENKKIEIIRETERKRMEMENKRMEMILKSQQKIVDTIGRAFGS